mgnify:CR=1 FL=1
MLNKRFFTLYCDNKSTIDLANNPVQHSRTKHIDLRYHFIKKLVEEKCLVLEHVVNDKQLADIFTKPLDVKRFESLISDLGVFYYESI